MPPKKEEKAAPVLLGRISNNLRMGVVGLPNVGKSTFFNALTKSAARAENFPFCTIDPEDGRVAVPDPRFDWLCSTYKPASKVPAYLNVTDIAGLVKGASTGAGLGNALLSHIKAVDGIFHMVRSFDGEEIVHVEGDVDPIRDMNIIVEELRLKDLEFLGKSVEAAKKGLRGHESDKAKKFELDTLLKLQSWLTEADGTGVHSAIRFGEWSGKEIEEIINPLQLITAKPVIFMVNMTPTDYISRRNRWLPKIKAWIDANSPGDLFIPFSGAFETTLASFSTKTEQDEYLQSLLAELPAPAANAPPAPAPQSALSKIIVGGYKALNLANFFTAGEDEVRAWTIRVGTKAPTAAGVIHTDFEKTFIMAEVMRYEDLVANGSENGVKGAGKYYMKGKEYVVEDGDIIYFKAGAAKSKK